MTIEEATLNDLPAMSRLRAEHWGAANEWEPRITAYMIRQQTPQFGLQPRAVYVAVDDNEVVGLIAGHLTTRFACQGELQWLNVANTHRGRRIADALLHKLAEWFIAEKAHKVCVNVAPSNDPARTVYTRHGAVSMGPQWLVFEDIRTAFAKPE
jgi:ribosomal protein S18 acetylase RimI-like enzyme